jgi:hypothetical protein
MPGFVAFDIASLLFDLRTFSSKVRSLPVRRKRGDRMLPGIRLELQK